MSQENSREQEWKEKVKSLLTGINKYNPEVIETLEKYVEFQSEKECYDFEANLTLLKLYQFSPQRVDRTVAAQILLKALTQLPNTDFVILKCVLAQNLQVDPIIQAVVGLHSLLECCQFKSFWLAVKELLDTVNKVTVFKTAIRSYICSIVDISYQNIPFAMLQDYLGGTDQETTTTLVQENGWSLKQEGGVAVVAIRNQEANIRPKKILAKIEFENVSGILASAASR